MKKKTKLIVKMQSLIDAQCEQEHSTTRSQVIVLAVSRKGRVHPAGIVFMGKGVTSQNPAVRVQMEKLKKIFQDQFPQAEHGWIWNELVVDEHATKTRKNRVWMSTPIDYGVKGQ